MSDRLRKVDYFHVMIPNTAGQASKIAGGLADAGVNLLAFSGFPSGKMTQLDLMPEDSGKLKRGSERTRAASCRQGSPASVTRATTGSARCREVFDKLADAKINLIAVDAVSSGKGRFGAIFWVKPEAVAKTAKLLGAK